MANKSVLELAVGTGQWDAGLKKAKDALNNFTQAQGGLQSALAADSDKMQQFVKMMGQMDSQAKTAKGQLNDYKGTIEQLTMQYNRMTDAQKKTIGQDYLQAIDHLKQKYQSVNKEIEEMNRQLKATPEITPSVSGGGGLFGEGGFTGMLAVTGGNLLAQGITKLGAEIGDTIQQSIELARQGEGIRIAFERLNRPDLLDKLKEATHGTVSELELMKQAVKFNDFKLNLDEMGTLLAFAQQKAKDTGQSVDYMVDSIVTGLGRQSLMILDNLGLSAAQIKERMKETGDMTSAVASIIKDQMSEAGEYVETAADRAARAAADATNEMERLGREAQPFAEEWAKAWNEIKIGGMQVLTTVFGPLAESARQIRQILNGEFKFKAGVPNLAEGGKSPWAGWKPGTDNTIQVPGGYVEMTDANTGEVIGGKHFDNLNDTNAIKEWQKSLTRSAKTTKTGGTSPQEQAEKKVADALHAYGQAIAQAALEQKSGTITEAGAKKKELQAQENLWKAYGDAYNIYKAPKYKDAQDLAAQRIVELGGTVKELTQAEDAAKKSAQDLAAVQKKQTNALDALVKAAESNDLGAFYKAQKQYKEAGGTANTAFDPTYTSANLDAFIANLKERISQADMGTELFDSLNAQLADAQSLGNLMKTAIENGIDAAQFEPQEIFKRIFGDGKTAGDYIGNEFWQGILNSMSQQTGKKFSLDTRSGAVTTDKGGKDGVEQFMGDFSKITGSISNIASGIQALGVEIPEGLAKTIGVIQTISGILTAILAITTAIQATSSVNATASVIDAVVPFARGGKVPKAATGYYVPGKRYSGDTTPILANAGELVLNKSSQGNLAAMIRNAESLVGMIDRYQNSFLGRTQYGNEAANFSGGAMSNLKLSATVSGEQIRLVLKNNGRRTGRGEYVTSNFTRG